MPLLGFSLYKSTTKLISGNSVLSMVLQGVGNFFLTSFCVVLYYLDKKTITVAETLQQSTGGNYTDKPKTDSSYRTLPMTDKVYTVLEAHKRLQEQRKELMGNYYVCNDYVCTQANGEIITPNYLTRTFHSIVSKSNLPQIRLHDLLHTNATLLIASGVPITTVAKRFGHTDSTTTGKIYAHAIRSADEAAAETLENILTPTLSRNVG